MSAGTPDAALRQLAFGFGADVSLARADFVATDANREALAWIEAWQDWPAGRLVLSGPAGSGRTHLAAIFAAQAGAAVIDSTSLAGTPPPALLPTHGRIAVEAADRAPEQALLHLLNLSHESGGRVLLTADRPPAHWGVALRDLGSRLAASGAASLKLPDEALLRAVLAKAAADRQMALAPSLLDWLAARVPRSLTAAAAAIAALDSASMAAGRPPDLRLARPLVGRAPDSNDEREIARSDEIPMTAATFPSPGSEPLG
jgi:chromosomal replication initiation ATPase DnaA